MSKDLKQRSVLVKGGKQEKQRAKSRAEGGAATGVTSEMRMPDVPLHFYPGHRTVSAASRRLGSLRCLSTFVSEDSIVSQRKISFK